MDFDLSDEQRMIADTVGGILRSGERADLWKAFVEGGLSGMTFSEAQGGAGLGLLALIPAMVELGRSERQTSLVGGAVLPGLLSTQVDVPEYEPTKVAWGETRAAIALPENLCGLQADGSKLSGTIRQVLGGGDAQLLLLCQRDDTCAAIDLTNAGITVSKYRLVDGHSVADIKLIDVNVAWSQTKADLSTWLTDAAATLLCAVALGAANAMRDLTRDYILTREQFGKPISTFQVLQHDMVDIWHDTEHFASLVYAAAHSCDRMDVPARQRAVSSLKRFCGTRMRAAAASSIQMHGGIGVTEDYALNIYIKRIILADMLFGTADIHAARLGQLIATTARQEQNAYS